MSLEPLPAQAILLPFPLEVFFLIHHPRIHLVSGEHITKDQDSRSFPIFCYLYLKIFKPFQKNITRIWRSIDLLRGNSRVGKFEI